MHSTVTLCLGTVQLEMDLPVLSHKRLTKVVAQMNTANVGIFVLLKPVIHTAFRFQSGVCLMD